MRNESFFKRGLQLTFLGLVIYVVVMVLAATNAKAATCITKDAVTAELVARVTGLASVSPEPHAYMRAFNQTPPTTQIPIPEELMVFSAPEKRNVLIVGFAGGCQVFVHTLRGADHARIMSDIKKGV